MGKTAWAWFVRFVDVVWRFYVTNVAPQYVVAVFAIFNAAITIAAWFITQTWTDFYTVSGYWITLTGLLVAIGELYRARTVAAEIKKALNEEVRRQRGNHYRYCLEQAKSSLVDARAQVQARQWKVAVVRLNDLISQLSHFNSISPPVDDYWTILQDSLHRWVTKFDAGKSQKTLEYNMGEWQQLVTAILNQLENELAPFQFGEERNDDTE